MATANLPSSNPGEPGIDLAWLASKIPYSHYQDCVHCGLCTASCPTYVETVRRERQPPGADLPDAGRRRRPARRPRPRSAITSTSASTAGPASRPAPRASSTARSSSRSRSPSTPRPRPATGPGSLQRLILHHLFPYAGRVKAALAPARLLQKLGAARPRREGRPDQAPAADPPADAGDAADPDGRRQPASRASCRRSARSGRGSPSSSAAWPTRCSPRPTPRPPGSSRRTAARSSSRRARAAAARSTTTRAPKAPRSTSPARTSPRSTPTASTPSSSTPPAAGRCSRTTPTSCPAEDEAAAKKFVAKVRDISEFLVELGPIAPEHPLPMKVTYHDPCHLCHGQQVRAQPRQLLGMIPGLELVPLDESELCCGAAGTYNLTQPEMSERLGRRKMDRIDATGADGRRHRQRRLHPPDRPPDQAGRQPDPRSSTRSTCSTSPIEVERPARPRSQTMKTPTLYVILDINGSSLRRDGSRPGEGRPLQAPR